VDLAKEVVGVEVAEEEGLEAVAGAVEEAVAEAEEEAVANQQQQPQPHQPTHLEMDSKEYHLPYSKEIPSCLTRSNRNGDYTGLPTSITTT
jgi:hypothetical protein